MLGLSGVIAGDGEVLHGLSFPASVVFAWLAFGLAIVWFLPNTQQLLARYAPAWDRVEAAGRQWNLHWTKGIAAGLLFAASLLMLQRSSEFLYFQF
jgi:hypothetical protein